jgi:hypothetical protein
MSLQSIFDTVPKTNHLRFIEESKPQPKRVVSFLKLTQRDVAKLSGYPVSSIRYDHRLPTEVADRLMEVGVICEAVADFFGGDEEKTRLWFRTANPLLGGITPRDMIRLGRHKRLMQFVLEAKSGDLP